MRKNSSRVLRDKRGTRKIRLLFMSIYLKESFTEIAFIRIFCLVYEIPKSSFVDAHFCLIKVLQVFSFKNSVIPKYL